MYDAFSCMLDYMDVKYTYHIYFRILCVCDNILNEHQKSPDVAWLVTMCKELLWDLTNRITATFLYQDNKIDVSLSCVNATLITSPWLKRGVGGRVHIVSYKKNVYHISDVWPMFSERCCYRVIKNHEFAHKREMITENRIIHGACKNENAGE